MNKYKKLIKGITLKEYMVKMMLGGGMSLI